MKQSIENVRDRSKKLLKRENYIFLQFELDLALPKFNDRLTVKC